MIVDDFTITTPAGALFARRSKASAPARIAVPIVLLHDSARYAPRESAEPTAMALWEICEEARRRGVGWGSL